MVRVPTPDEATCGGAFMQSSLAAAEALRRSDDLLDENDARSSTRTRFVAAGGRDRAAEGAEAADKDLAALERGDTTVAPPAAQTQPEPEATQLPATTAGLVPVAMEKRLVKEAVESEMPANCTHAAAAAQAALANADGAAGMVRAVSSVRAPPKELICQAHADLPAFTRDVVECCFFQAHTLKQNVVTEVLQPPPGFLATRSTCIRARSSSAHAARRVDSP